MGSRRAGASESTMRKEGCCSGEWRATLELGDEGIPSLREKGVGSAERSVLVPRRSVMASAVTYKNWIM